MESRKGRVWGWFVVLRSLQWQGKHLTCIVWSCWRFDSTQAMQEGIILPACATGPSRSQTSCCIWSQETWAVWHPSQCTCFRVAQSPNVHAAWIWCLTSTNRFRRCSDGVMVSMQECATATSTSKKKARQAACDELLDAETSLLGECKARWVQTDFIALSCAHLRRVQMTGNTRWPGNVS